MNLKQFILTISIVFLCLLLATAKKIKSPFPNTVPVEGDYLYAAESEVSNVQYKEFLAHIKKTKGEDAYWQMYPDTTVWRQKLGFTEPFVSYYFNHPVYNDYPVVGVSKSQARAYCNWLTEIVSQKLPAEFKKIQVRLPMKKEWEDAARAGHTEYNLPNGLNKYRMGKGDPRKYHGALMYNFRRYKGEDVASQLNEAGVITAPVRSYWKNDYGIYNMSGNVAEMVLDDTIVKGGSWSSSGYFMQIEADDYGLNSNNPSSEVGFRYFIEVMDYDKTPGKDKKITAKKISKNITEIDSNLFACKGECSNIDFREFLKKYPQYAPNYSNWLQFGARKLFKKYSWHPDYDLYPVVNITHEGATEFCNWLTNIYNTDPKRKYKKVRFKLPTKREWELAASSGKKSNIYPWGGSYLRNNRGAHLANYNPIPQQHKKTNAQGKTELVEINQHIFENLVEDGCKYTCWVGSYFPNALGLYNCSGNAAEMTSTKGLAKGGSWGSTANYLNIYTDVNQDSPYFYSRVYLPNSDTSPFLGFRYFMEISEY